MNVNEEKKQILKTILTDEYIDNCEENKLNNLIKIVLEIENKFVPFIPESPTTKTITTIYGVNLT
jgi:hypothetical protein